MISNDFISGVILIIMMMMMGDGDDDDGDDNDDDNGDIYANIGETFKVFVLA